MIYHEKEMTLHPIEKNTQPPLPMHNENLFGLTPDPPKKEKQRELTEEEKQKLIEEEASKKLMLQGQSIWLTDKFVERPFIVIFLG